MVNFWVCLVFSYSDLKLEVGKKVHIHFWKHCFLKQFAFTGSRETALDTAKQYYELCNQRPQEILNGIVEKGPMYTQEEYANIIKLLNRSDITSSSHKLASQLEKLGDIMKKVGVAV